ncbi:MAG: HAD-IB family phosphatase [Candidatus Thorarchaeota archaeon]
MKKIIKVISFDLDGVLFDGPSATYPIAKKLGIDDKFDSVLQRVQNEQLSLDELIIEGSKIWIGVPVDGTLDSIIETMPLMNGAEDTVATLKKWGYLVGCISSGVSQFFMKPLAARLSLDFAFSNMLDVKNGRHDGTVSFIMNGPAKANTAIKYLTEQGLSRDNLASIGDGENDINLFNISSFSIAFNPTSDRVTDAASITVRTKDLRSILPHFNPDFP